MLRVHRCHCGAAITFVIRTNSDLQLMRCDRTGRTVGRNGVLYRPHCQSTALSPETRKIVDQNLL